VVCCARRENKLRETVNMIDKKGGRGLAIPTDVTQPQQVENMVAETLRHFEQIDVLINNAGSFYAIGGLWEVDPEVWWQDVAVNLRGPMLCCHKVLPHMMERDQGVIINMNGGGSTKPLPGGSGYGCSKAALLRMTDGLAQELERVGSSVYVFAMGPGFVRTEMSEYQAQVPEGIRWIPSSKEGLDKGQTSPPELCAEGMVRLVRHACRELSGRVFGATTDFSEMVQLGKEIYENDLYVMRFRSRHSHK